METETKNKLEAAIVACAEKAISSEKSDDALKYTQAALNAANAIRLYHTPQ